MSFKVPEGHRVRKGQLQTSGAMLNNGVFTFAGNEILFDEQDKPYKSPIMFVCVASDHDFFEQVAISVQRPGRPRFPTMDEVSAIRQMFWKGEGDNVFVYMPNDSFKDDGAMIITLWNKPGFNFPTPNFERMGLERKNLIQKINDILG